MATSRRPRQGRNARAPRVRSAEVRRRLAPDVLPFAARWEAAIARAWSAAIERLAEEIDRALRARRADADEFDAADLRRIFASVNREQDRALRAQLPGVAIPDVVSGGARLAERWVRQNVDLIKVDERVRRELEAFLSGPLRSGLSQRELRDRLQERFDLGLRRAQLIARDQTLKLAGQLNEQRQRQIGARRYVWTTSGDERVRDDHAELDGRVFEWDDPPATNASEVRRGRPERRGHPGSDYQCRCVAEVVLDDDPEELEPEDEQPRAPEPEPPPPEPPIVPEPVRPPPLPAAVDRLAERAQRIAAARAEQERRQAASRALVANQPLVRAPAHTPASVRGAVDAALARLPLERLRGSPVAAVQVTDRVGAGELGESVFGNYSPSSRTVRVSFNEATLAVGRKTRVPIAEWSTRRVGNISDFAADDAGLVEITVTHEVGHHVHLQGSERPVKLGRRLAADGEDAANDIVVRAYHSSAREFVSGYGNSAPWEYFAEAFAAYHHLPIEWRAAHPRATRMVESVMRLRGML